jgi:MFS family permease
MAQAMTHQHTGARRYDTSGDVREHAVVDEGLQRSKYGGFHFGTALFGWLVSTGVAAILTSLLAAAGAAVAVSKFSDAQSATAQQATTVGLVSGILMLIVLAIAYYAGGYVAGRMSRFDGARQGVGVWVIGVLVTIVLGAIGAALGAKYNVLQQLNLPHLPIKQGGFTTGGLITSLVALVVTLLAAMSGGKVGERFHRKIDAAGTVDTVT